MQGWQKACVQATVSGRERNSAEIWDLAELPRRTLAALLLAPSSVGQQQSFPELSMHSGKQH